MGKIKKITRAICQHELGKFVVFSPVEAFSSVLSLDWDGLFLTQKCHMGSRVRMYRCTSVCEHLPDWLPSTHVPSSQQSSLSLPTEDQPFQNQAEPVIAADMEHDAIWKYSVYLKPRSLACEEESRHEQWSLNLYVFLSCCDFIFSEQFNEDSWGKN